LTSTDNAQLVIEQINSDLNISTYTSSGTVIFDSFGNDTFSSQTNLVPLSLTLGGNRVNAIDTDPTLSANVDTSLSTQKATKSYVDNAISTISLTPGPTGPPGTTGAQGPPGPEGPVASNFQVLSIHRIGGSLPGMITVLQTGPDSDGQNQYICLVSYYEVAVTASLSTMSIAFTPSLLPAVATAVTNSLASPLISFSGGIPMSGLSYISASSITIRPLSGSTFGTDGTLQVNQCTLSARTQP